MIDKRKNQVDNEVCHSIECYNSKFGSLNCFIHMYKPDLNKF